MIDSDRVWRSLTQHARQAAEAPPSAMPDGFARRVVAHLPAVRVATLVRQRERWVLRAAAAAVVVAGLTTAWQWPAIADSTSVPVALEDIVSLEPVP